ncbi:transglutaminase-like protein [Roseburia sp. CAG:380]|nr:transglutaminase-like protein [Roseburia sp. CAG:380]
MFRRKKNRDEITNIELTEGMMICPEYQGSENRMKTLLLKGVLVYLLVMGVMGSYLSALDIRFSWVALHVVIFLCTMYCAALYYSKLWQDIGYLLLLGAMAVGGCLLGKYINSGFYSVANDLSEAASEFFDSNAMRSYGEQVGNRYFAVTVSMSYIGCVCCVIANILVSRKMRCGIVLLAAAGTLAMPLYLEKEPSFLYTVMLLAGTVLCFMIRSGGHYRLTFDNHAYTWKEKKRRIDYVYSSAELAQLICAVLTGSVLLLGVANLLYPRTLHQQIRGTSQMKKDSLEIVENVSMLGIAGLFNFYPNTGGLTSGTLGGVSAIRYDYETDLKIRFAPYTQNRIYFKSFTGNEYLPFRNRWQRQTDETGQAVAERVDITTDRMKNNYRKGKKNTGKGKIAVKNVAAATGVYLPYYSEDISQEVYPGAELIYTFYPSLSGQKLKGLSDERKQALADWRDVPEEDMKAVSSLCQAAGLSGSLSVRENVQRLAQYYQENIPYSYRPGATPYQEDFVNYFLTKNRRGYCAHFASAATLAFRYIGIPARYVEGYAVDPQDVSEEGTIEYDEKYEAYYEGTSEVGKTAVVSVNVTDANAHAWVEVYDESLGWQVADVTPVSGEKEEDNGLWKRILNFLGAGGNLQDDTGGKASGNDTSPIVQQMKRTSIYISVVVAAVLVTAFPVMICGKHVVWLWHFWRSDRNDRLILVYQRRLKHIAARHPSLTENKNYKDQLNWLVRHGYWQADVVRLEKAVSILEKAGFSKQTVSSQEYKLIRSGFCRNNKSAGADTGRK